MSYKGKNTIKPLRFLFQERAKWFNHFRDETGAFIENKYYETNIFENVFFQRINGRFETIIPKENLIKTVSMDGGKIISGLNFAVDAFLKFSSDLKSMNKDFSTGLDSDQDPYLNVPMVYQSYVSPVVQYDYYTDDLMRSFIDHIKINSLHSNIAHFGDFVNLFISFLKQKGPKFPISMTAWQKSVNSNIFTSGMAFSVAPLNCGDDIQKEEFINSPLFSNYVNTAAQNGFAVMAGCPWILLAAPVSVKMQDFSKEYDLNSKDAIYSAAFDKTYLGDIAQIKNILKIYYNLYINKYKYYKELIYTGSKTIQKIINREEISTEQMNSNYKDLYWLLIYNEIRNIEEENMFNKAEFEVIKKKSNFFSQKT